MQPPWQREKIRLQPIDYERRVRRCLESLAVGLEEFRAEHRESLQGSDGEYEIDITARFRAMGGDFLVLVECKHYSHPIKREVVQVLHDRIQSMRAHKGMLFSTSTFQSGAIEYAKHHRIALAHFVKGDPVFEARSWRGLSEPPPWLKIMSGILLYIVTLNEDGKFSYCNDVAEQLNRLLFE